MNKKHWITITLDGELPEEMVVERSNGSYDLVVSRLAKVEKKKMINSEAKIEMPTDTIFQGLMGGSSFATHLCRC
ncbi:MAG: hypothetical protein H8D23_18870 [Candidatus Brocadiales bacterium]|nr:hypothetical protein [Candidatus Brocadiales bacterium]